ncbi:hypothetical protein [Luteolibacter sp. AS25]|uniref:hypothetical protein n=1 Tax=Luteolibacter sp. AS25 TaxID=3135776 RepID=UPI00398A6C91
MNPTFLQKAFKQTKLSVFVLITALALNGCGGGGGSSNTTGVAPQSLDSVTIRFFSSMQLLFEATGVSGGQESGSVTYTQLLETFSTTLDVNGSQSTTSVATPDTMSGVRYVYTPTSGDSGQLVINFSSASFDDLSTFRRTSFSSNTILISIGEPHRIFSDAGVNTITFDILFTSNGASITGATIRTEDIDVNSNNSIYADRTINSGLNASGTVDNDVVTFALNGSALPAGYSPNFDANAILSGVPTTLVDRTIVLNGVTPNLRIAFNSNSAGVATPALSTAEIVEESGSILMTEDGATTGAADGAYAYTRIGGALSELGIQTTNISGTNSTIPSAAVIYTLNFNNLTYTGSDGTSGAFTDEGARTTGTL